MVDRVSFSKLTAVVVVLLIAVIVAGCAAGEPTATPMLPTPTDTVAVGTPVPTDTPILPTATIAPTEVPTEASTPTEETQASPTVAATETPGASGSVGDYQWKRVGLPGEALQDLALLLTGDNKAVVAGATGAWSSVYDYSKWDPLNVTLGGRTTSTALGSDDIIYVTSNTGCASGGPASLQYTTNGGTTWQTISSGTVPLRVAAANSSVAYGTTCSGIVKTNDSGATWTVLPQSHIENYDAGAVTASPDGQTVFAAHYSEGGSVKVNGSTDGGNTWAEITPKGEEQNLRAPALLFLVTGTEGHPEQSGLYMATSPGKLWLLPQGGGAADWKLAQGSNPQADSGTGYEITALFVDTSNNEQYNKPGPVVYTARATRNDTGMQGQGVYRSINGGQTWEQVGTGLDAHAVNGLGLAPHENLLTAAKAVDTLLAATDDGVWAATMPPPFK